MSKRLLMVGSMLSVLASFLMAWQRAFARRPGMLIGGGRRKQ